MSSIQQQGSKVFMASSRVIARQVSRGLHSSHGKSGAKAVTQPLRPSTHAAATGVMPPPSGAGVPFSVDHGASSTSQQAMFQNAREGSEWGLPPVERLQNAVDAFRKQHFIDELPSRTQKSIVEAAANGKGYVTPEDITRVLANISEGKTVLTPVEAGNICATWGEAEAAGPAMSKHAFLRLLDTRSN